MAPITVAVESLTTPADAITADSGSSSQNGSDGGCVRDPRRKAGRASA